MEKRLSFTVPGNPLPKQSGQITTVIKGNQRIRMMYTKQETRDWEKKVSDYAFEACGGKVTFKPPAVVSVTVTFYRGTKHRVDLLNLAKPVVDAMKGLIFEDDAAGTYIVEERYIWGGYDTENPRVEITVEER